MDELGIRDASRCTGVTWTYTGRSGQETTQGWPHCATHNTEKPYPGRPEEGVISTQQDRLHAQNCCRKPRRDKEPCATQRAQSMTPACTEDVPLQPPCKLTTHGDGHGAAVSTTRASAYFTSGHNSVDRTYLDRLSQIRSASPPVAENHEMLAFSRTQEKSPSHLDISLQWLLPVNPADTTLPSVPPS